MIDGSDFINRLIPVFMLTSTATGAFQETCATVRILDNVFFEEDVECFKLSLSLDPFVLRQPDVIVAPNVTMICIEDNDGKQLSYACLRDKFTSDFLLSIG